MKKTVLITGASSGFGRETAGLFQRNGWNVIATMRSPEKENELAGLQDVEVTRLDVQDEASIKSAVQAGADRFGRIDVLVNNAGYGLMGVFEAATKAQIQNQFEVNVFGAMLTTQAVLPLMRQVGKGAIVNVSTFGGLVGFPFSSLYNSSKFALEGFSEALSHELAKFNIGVKIIEPGGVPTNFRNGLDIIKNDIEPYDPLMTAFFGRYVKTTETLQKATPANVAGTIYRAATDESSKLRYVIGDDAQFYIDTKIKNTEEQFIRSIRAFFVD